MGGRKTNPPRQNPVPVQQHPLLGIEEGPLSGTNPLIRVTKITLAQPEKPAALTFG